MNYEVICLNIRSAKTSDAERLLKIYSYYVENNTPKKRARKRRQNDNDWKWGDEK